MLKVLVSRKLAAGFGVGCENARKVLSGPALRRHASSTPLASRTKGPRNTGSGGTLSEIRSMSGATTRTTGLSASTQTRLFSSNEASNKVSFSYLIQKESAEGSQDSGTTLKGINSGCSSILELAGSKKRIYVDKTLEIFEMLCDCQKRQVLLTRPRRFGKTLLLDHIEAFYDGTLHDAIECNIRGDPPECGDVLKMQSVAKAALYTALRALRSPRFSENQDTVYSEKICQISEEALEDAISCMIEEIDFTPKMHEKLTNKRHILKAKLAVQAEAENAIRKVEFMRTTKVAQAKKELPWKRASVLKFDFSRGYGRNFAEAASQAIYSAIVTRLQSDFNDYKEKNYGKLLGDYLHNSNPVILIDEYDKPIHDLFPPNKEPNVDAVNAIVACLAAFFGIMKSQSKDSPFAIVTGVTKLAAMGLLSGIHLIR